MSIPPIIRPHGDPDTCQRFIGVAKSQLDILKNLMSFRSLSQGVRNVTVQAGGVDKGAYSRADLELESEIINPPEEDTKESVNWIEDYGRQMYYDLEKLIRTVDRVYKVPEKAVCPKVDVRIRKIYNTEICDIIAFKPKEAREIESIWCSVETPEIVEPEDGASFDGEGVTIPFKGNEFDSSSKYVKHVGSELEIVSGEGQSWKYTISSDGTEGQPLTEFSPISFHTGEYYARLRYITDTCSGSRYSRIIKFTVNKEDGDEGDSGDTGADDIIGYSYWLDIAYSPRHYVKTLSESTLVYPDKDGSPYTVKRQQYESYTKVYSHYFGYTTLVELQEELEKKESWPINFRHKSTSGSTQNYYWNKDGISVSERPYLGVYSYFPPDAESFSYTEGDNTTRDWAGIMVGMVNDWGYRLTGTGSVISVIVPPELVDNRLKYGKFSKELDDDGFEIFRLTYFR